MSSLSFIQQDLSNIETIIDNLNYQWGSIDGLVSDVSTFMSGYDLAALENMADSISAYNNQLSIVVNSLSEVDITVVDNTIASSELLINNIYSDLSAIATTLSGFAPNENLVVTLSNATEIFSSITSINNGVNHLFSVPNSTISGNNLFYSGAEIGGLLKQQLALWYYVNGVPTTGETIQDDLSYYPTSLVDVEGRNIYVTSTALRQFDLSGFAGSNINDFETDSYAQFATLSTLMTELGNDVSNTFVQGKTTLVNLTNSLTSKLNSAKANNWSWGAPKIPNPENPNLVV